MAINRSGLQGGARLRRFVRTVRKAPAKSAKSVDVGFFKTARYPNGTPVAAVAAWNEFGTSRGTPERPFFRNAIKGASYDLMPVLLEVVEPGNMEFTTIAANRVGLAMQGRVQKSITVLRDPPNAPSTIRRKGSSNPLIRDGFMRESVTYVVNE